ncbi:MAG TPA: YihY/virulence factor BrkB family protein [Sphingobacteriaceae bacterium]
MEKFTLKSIGDLFKDTGKNFVRDEIPKQSAALAYYTIFSLGPMLIVIIFLAGVFWSQSAVEGRIFGQIRDLVGDKAALQIQEIIKSAAVSANSTLAGVIGLLTLLIGATTIFAEIQNSINSIWRLKVKAKKGWLKMLKNRFISFSLVVSLGFLLLVSLMINGLVEGLMDRLKELFPQGTVILLYVLNLVITLLVTSALFAIIFKVLPDAIIRWRDVMVGAIFTAILFMIGKLAITLYIGQSSVASSFGAASSLVVLLLWVYYSSIILYFGAEFTKMYAIKFGAAIKPAKYAVIVQTIQLERSQGTVQESEKETENTERVMQEATDRAENAVHNNPDGNRM